MKNGNFPSDDDLLAKLDDYEPGDSAAQPDLDIAAPVTAPIANPTLTKYEAEKLVGIRGSGGYPQIKKLQPKHKQVLAMHVVGKSLNEIADATGYTYGYVALVIGSPSSKEFIAKLTEVYDSEIHSLLPLAILAVREALLSDSMKMRLAGVDRYIKLAGPSGKDTGKESEGGNVYNFAFINTARENFVKELKLITEKGTVVDMVPIEGEAESEEESNDTVANG